MELTVPWEKRMEDKYGRKWGNIKSLWQTVRTEGGEYGVSQWRLECGALFGIHSDQPCEYWNIRLERIQLIGRLSRDAEIASLWL